MTYKPSTFHWKQTDWYIDPSGGNDLNTGIDSGHALKTMVALINKLQGATINQTTQIHLLGNISNGDSVPWEIKLGPNGFLKFIGTKTSVFSGTITGSAILNRNLSIATQVVSSWTVTSVENKLAIDTTTGASAWINQEDLGAGNAILSPFVTMDDSSISTIGNHPTQVNQVNGDLISVYTLSTLPIDITVETTGGQNQLFFKDLALSGASGQGKIYIDGGVAFHRCDTSNVRLGRGKAFASCCRQSGGTIASITGTPAQFHNYAGYVPAAITVSRGGIYVVDDDTLTDGSISGVGIASVIEGGYIIIGNACSRNASSFGMVMRGMSRAKVTGIWWKSGTVDYALSIARCCRFIYGTVPTITGALADIALEDLLVTYQWTVAPFHDVNNDISVQVAT